MGTSRKLQLLLEQYEDVCSDNAIVEVGKWSDDYVPYGETYIKSGEYIVNTSEVDEHSIKLRNENIKDFIIENRTLLKST